MPPHRAVAIALLASPLALLLNGHGSAAPDGGVVLDPVLLDIEFDLRHTHAVAAGPEGLSSAWVELTTSDDGPVLEFETTVEDPEGPLSIVVEDDRSYVMTARAHFIVDAPDLSEYAYLEIDRSASLSVHSGAVSPVDATELYQEFGRIMGTVALDDDSAARSILSHVNICAVGSNGGSQTAFRGCHRTPTNTNWSDVDAAFDVRMVPDVGAGVDGLIELTGYAYVLVPLAYDPEGNPTSYVSRVYSIAPQYPTFVGADEDNVQFGNLEVRATLDEDYPRGAEVLGDISAMSHIGYQPAMGNGQSLGGFYRQRLRGSVPGIPSSSYASPYIMDEDGAFSITNRILGENVLYSQHWWSDPEGITPDRYLRRPDRPVVFVQAGPAPVADFASPIVEIAGQIDLVGFYDEVSDFAQLTVEATSAVGSGLSRTDLDPASAISGAFALPVVEGDWTIHRVRAEREEADVINSYYEVIDPSLEMVSIGSVTAISEPVELAEPYSLDLYPAAVVFDISTLGEAIAGDYSFGEGYIIGRECGVSPVDSHEALYAVTADTSRQATKTTRFLAPNGCYVFDATIESFYDQGMDGIPDNDVRTVSQWSEVQVVVEGQSCETLCSFLDDAVDLFFPTGGDLPIVVTETAVGPDFGNFGISDLDPLGGIVYYNIEIDGDPIFPEGEEVEICITYDDSSLEINENLLRLYHYDPGPPNCQGGGVHRSQGWCELDEQTLNVAENSVCALTRSFSPFVILPMADDDGDYVSDTVDNCLGVANPSQADSDLDGLGDSCDEVNDGGGLPPGGGDGTCPGDAGGPDTDGDGIVDACDDDDDDDGVDDDADNCPLICNPEQADDDGDGAGNECDADVDGDGIDDGADNCPMSWNPSQKDTNGDNEGDACDVDDDGDGVLDGTDNCPLVANGGQNDFDGDGIGDACEAA